MLGAGAAGAQTSTFFGLSEPFGTGTGIASVGGVSGDGSVVVGGASAQSGTTFLYRAFRWRQGGGFDSPVPPRPGTLGAATGISADGCVIVGSTAATGTVTGWIVSDGGVTYLAGRTLAGISADGTRCVGWSAPDATTGSDERAGVYSIARALWTDLDLPAGLAPSRALAVSDGGAVVIGEAAVRGGVLSEAFVRTASGVTRLPSRGGLLSASTVRVSNSGTLVAGSNMDRVEDPAEGFVHDRVAWTWTAGSGVVEVASDFEVRAVSPDGKILVGSRVDDEYGTPEQAMMWDGVRGLREVRTALAQAGLADELYEWILLTADTISQAGEVYAIAGTGLDPQGRRAAWVATLASPPAPSRTAGAHAVPPAAGIANPPPEAPHVDQRLLTAMARSGNRSGARELAFDIGDKLFNNTLNDADGVGANVGNGERFTRVPRADLAGPGQWASHVPARPTGPSAASCNACHGRPADDGAGRIETNIVSDPLRTGRLDSMIQRSTPHLFGAGAIQRLAEEMTDDLQRTARAASDEACRTGAPVTRELASKGVKFGSITARPSGEHPCTATLETSRVEGVSGDLIVRPFNWKGSTASLRRFTRDAAHHEIGMQGVELVGEGRDGDFDGVVNELSVGDITALAVYLAGQPRPTTRTELAALGLVDAVSGAELGAIARGRERFSAAGCAVCHVPTMICEDPVFAEPSRSPFFRDAAFPAGQDPAALGLSGAAAILFDLTQDQPDNRFAIENEHAPALLGAFVRDERGRAIVELYGDLKRHDMGPGLAESIDEIGTGRAVFLTENLWGVGSTAPYLHDGRAATLAEAILAHGGEAQSSRDAFAAMPDHEKRDILTFLNNMVLYKNR